MTSRRKVLRYLGISTASLGSLGLFTYSYNRGIRLPTLHWDPLPLDTQFRIIGAQSAIGHDLIQTPNARVLDGTINGSFRAFAPEPLLKLICDGPCSLTISISNISPEAILNASHENIILKETSNKTNRTVTIETTASAQISLQWRLPEWGTYTFASIGDTGGDKELLWCIERAHALGAKFLLHLGDFNYQDTDYRRSIEAFNQAPLPVYVSIGNHDFHDDGAIYPQFLREIGPLNNVFSIGKTRFVNIDTAANVLPYGAGQRGDMFNHMELDNNYTETVAFTHCPLFDPVAERHHDMGSAGERDWLIKALKRVNAKTLLSGHIHIYHRGDFNGIDNIIAGQGLGHQDLLINGDASKMVLGHVDDSGAVRFTAEPLAMPMEAHCHPRIDPVKDSLRDSEHQEILEVLTRACNTE